MASAPPQGFTGSTDTASIIEDGNNRRAAEEFDLMRQNNGLLNILVKHFEVVTNEENIDGGKLVDNN